MWLPREARVGVAPAISKHSTRKTKIPGAPPLSPNIAHHRTEDNQEAKAYLLGREQEIPAPKEKPTSGRKATTDRLWVQWVVDKENDERMQLRQL